MSLPSPRASRALLALTVVAAGVFGSGLAANAGSTGTRPSALPTLDKSAPASVLVNAQGMTLYVFAHDKMNTSNCYDTSAFKCATLWPPATVAKGTTVPKTIPGIAGTFGTTKRKDGTLQLTFDGAPLYTWIKDKKPGDMTGQGVAGVWWTVVTSTKAGATAGDSALVKTAPAHILVNKQGMTLYVFAHDKMNTSNCYDTSAFKCATYWPPLLLPTHYVMHNASAKSTWGVAMRKDGSRQLTYYGAPLYTWIKDKKPGDMTGQGVGGVWWVVTV